MIAHVAYLRTHLHGTDDMYFKKSFDVIKPPVHRELCYTRPGRGELCYTRRELCHTRKLFSPIVLYLNMPKRNCPRSNSRNLSQHQLPRYVEPLTAETTCWPLLDVLLHVVNHINDVHLEETELVLLVKTC